MMPAATTPMPTAAAVAAAAVTAKINAMDLAVQVHCFATPPTRDKLQCFNLFADLTGCVYIRSSFSPYFVNILHIL